MIINGVHVKRENFICRETSSYKRECSPNELRKNVIVN